MKNSLNLATLITVIVLISACGSPRNKALEKVNDTENKTFSESGLIETKFVDELINAYVSFADQFPEDSLSPGYLFKAGDVAMNTNRSNKAIELYDRIIDDYNDYRKAPEALFLKGYVYENNLGRLDKAKAIYEEFLQKYPDNDFADDAEVSLKYLGKSPEELIEIFQRKAGEQ
jgi:TolA-binding protein